MTLDNPILKADKPSFPLLLSRAHLVGLLFVLVMLYYSSLHSYLLFHSLVELFSILVFFGIFIIAWNARHIIQNHYLLFLGIAYFFIGIIDLEHTLAYKGMGILVHADEADHATQLWIGARYTESLALLAAPFFMGRRIAARPVFVFFVIWTVFLLWLIHADIFPVCFVEGSGLTLFKKISEYLISTILATAFILLYRRRHLLDTKVYHLLAASLLFTIASELAFTFYVSVFGLSNLLGHIFKFISAYLLYLALVEIGLKTPYSLIFHELKQKTELLETREQEFRAIFELSAAGMAKIDPNSGRFTLVNRQLCRITGYGMEELLSMNVNDLTHPEDRPRQQETFADYLQGGSPFFQIEKRYIRKDGQIIWVLVTANVIRAETGEPLYAIGIVEDVTSRRRDRELLRESEEKFRLIAQNIEDVVWMSTPGLDRMLYINPAYEEVWGRSCQSLYDNPLSLLEAIHPEDRPMLDDAVQRHATGKWSFCYRIIQPDGNVRWIEDAGSPIYDIEGDILLMVVVARDITPRKMLEEQESRRKEELEREVSLRTAELARSMEQLRVLSLQISEIENQERRRIAEFLHDDLQQLLAAANMHVGRLVASMDPAGQEQGEVVTGILEQAIQASRSLSHDLSPPLLYRGSLKDVFTWLVDRKKTNHGLEVTLTMPDDLAVESDILRVFLYRSVKELLFNVVKHAETLEADLTVEMEEKDLLRIEVADRGRGIDPGRLQGTDSLAGEGGFGIFSIRERLQLLGGSLSVEGAPGEGSRFTMRLPLSGAADVVLPQGCQVQHAPAPQNTSRPLPAVCAEDRANRQIRIVIADDHEIMRHGLASLLRDEPDFEVVGQAADGKEAVRLVDELQPDVVVMDMTMPDMNGVEATERIARQFPEVVVIVHSMHEDKILADAVGDAGARAYCSKSGDTMQLLAAIRRHGAVITENAG